MDVIWIIFLFALGACVGSFLNVVIYRLPRGLSIVFPGSHCPHCGRPIRWHDNIPIVSWLLLRARCRSCRAPISPRYPAIETATAIRVVGLYLCYFVLATRRGTGPFADSWPMFLAHAALLCGLLACAVTDIDNWMVPLEVCWFVSLVGVASATAAPHPFMPAVSPALGAASVAAGIGLIVALLLMRYGVIRPSFLDAESKPRKDPEARPAPSKPKKAKSRKQKKRKKQRSARGVGEPGSRPGTEGARPAPRAAARATAAQTLLLPVRALVTLAATTILGYVPAWSKGESEGVQAVAITSAHGVRPRREILREVVFLAPALALGLLAYVLVAKVGPVGAAWSRLTRQEAAGRFAVHFNGFLAALFGYLIGGLWIWGTRILGTLGFGKEAMGLGDVHILAAVGAVCGWIVPSIAFFVAPFFGLVWALQLLITRRQRELPYGPWLAVASMAVMLFYDKAVVYPRRFAETIQYLFR